jgi:hypothetical protein
MSVNLDNNKIFDQLCKREKVGWSMSFDNIGPRFEYVRHGSSWSLLQSNLLRVQTQFDHGHWGGIHAVYNMYNATRLAEFVDWAKSQSLHTQWQSLYQPECLDPLKHQPGIRDLAVEQLDLVLSRTDLTDSEQSFFKQAHSNLQTAPAMDLGTKLKQHIQDIENLYHKDQTGKFDQLWPEISRLL